MSNEKTHLIIGDRQVGKTTRLIKESHEKGIPIVVWCNEYAKNILNKAREMNINIPDPVVVTSAIDLRGLASRSDMQNGCLIDDVDFFLPRLLGVKVVAATANLVSFENTELMTIEGHMRDILGSGRDSKYEEK